MNSNLNRKLNLIKELQDFEVEYKHLCAFKKILPKSETIYSNIENAKKIIPSERPDMIFILENQVIGVEVFEFSSYPTSRKKGNLVKRKENIVEQENLKERRKNGKKYFETHIETNLSKENYSNNFIKSFNEHYSKIEEYKENLRKYNKNNKIYFLIKDCTVDGNEIIYNDKPIFYYPLMNKEIFNFLMDKNKIDGIIFQCKAIFNQNVFFFLNNCKKVLNDLYKENKIYFDIELNKSNYIKIESFHAFNEDQTTY